MGTIMQRQKKDGATRFTAVIRKKKSGQVVVTLSDTFPSRQAAERWMKKTERDLKGEGALERAVAARHRKPQTVNSYMARLRPVVSYGGPNSKIDMPTAAFEIAMRTLKHHGMIGRSATRNRRPTLNSELHMVCDGLGRPLTFFLSPGQMSDAKGALALLDALPPARMLQADKGFDADGFRKALEDMGISTCIPARRGCIEKLFASRKDWRRIATRYDRCGELFPSAICIAATVML